MIEIEHNRVWFPAIDAGMIRKVCHEPHKVAVTMRCLKRREVCWIGDGHASVLVGTYDGARDRVKR